MLVNVAIVGILNGWGKPGMAVFHDDSAAGCSGCMQQGMFSSEQVFAGLLRVGCIDWLCDDDAGKNAPNRQLRA